MTGICLVHFDESRKTKIEFFDDKTIISKRVSDILIEGK